MELFLLSLYMLMALVGVFYIFLDVVKKAPHRKKAAQAREKREREIWEAIKKWKAKDQESKKRLLSAPKSRTKQGKAHVPSNLKSNSGTGKALPLQVRYKKGKPVSPQKKQEIAHRIHVPQIEKLRMIAWEKIKKSADIKIRLSNQVRRLSIWRALGLKKQGVHIHELCALLMKNENKDKIEWLKSYMPEGTSKECEDAVKIVKSAIRRYTNSHESRKIFTEYRLKGKQLKANGIVDVFVIQGDKALLFDYKSGSGDVKRPKYNPQLAAYATLIMESFSVKSVKGFIVKTKASEIIYDKSHLFSDREKITQRLNVDYIDDIQEKKGNFRNIKVTELSDKDFPNTPDSPSLF